MILDYLRETVTENGLDEHIRFGHRVLGGGVVLAGRGRWTVTRERAAGETVRADLRASCSPAPATTTTTPASRPQFDGVEDFAGQMVHPQHWPEDLDYAGKRVVVIGSGATAVTLIPSMAEHAAHVTMLQRSPSYVLSLPAEDPIANGAQPRPRPERAVPASSGARTSLDPAGIYKALPALPEADAPAADRRRPPPAAQGLRRRHALHARATRRGTSACAWCPTATCSRRSRQGGPRSSPTGSRASPSGASGWTSGQELVADIVVTATGLNMLPFGRIR